MDDDRLRRELQRRATRAAVPDFVSDVGPRLGSDRAQPARVAPWAPLAGLAAAAFLVVLLVIAWPRFGTGPASTASAIPSGSGTHDCGSVTNQVYGSTPVYALDSTGSVLSCALGNSNVNLLQRDGTVTVQQVPSQPDQLAVDWVTQECRPERVLLDIKPNDAGYALRVVVDRTGPDGYECVSTLQNGHAILTLSHPVEATSVSSELVLAPDVTADLPKTVDCAAMAGSSARVPKLVDHTGLVVGCSEVEARSASTGNVDASNPTDFDSVRYRWLDQTCSGPAAADFEAVDGGYRLAVAQPSPTCSPGVPVAIAVDYQIPMPAQLVTADYAQPAPVLACADTPYVTVVDEVGLVRSCASSESTASPGTDLVIANPDGDTTALQLSWVGSRCTYEVHFEPKNPYSIEIFNMSKTCPLRDVVLTVTLQLTTPIDADQITGWSIGGPPPTTVPASTPTPTPTPTTTPPPPTSPSDTSGDYRMTITSPRTVYSSGEAIDVQAALSYSGEQQSVALSGSGSGLIAFGIKQLDGTLEQDGLWTADCKLGGYTVSRDQPMVVPYIKGGGFDSSGPDAAFWQSYFAEPLLQLPPGHWQISAYAEFDEGQGCSANPIRLTASVDIDVTAPSASQAPS